MKSRPNNWVNQTAGSSVALIASKFSGRRWLPLAFTSAPCRIFMDTRSLPPPNPIQPQSEEGIIKNFKAQGLPLSKQGMEQTCDTLGVSASEVWAVLTVETGGFGFFQDRQPKILFERHIFHKLTNGKFDSGNPDISNAETGGYMSGQGEYPRLQKAMGMDEEAALQSASWGIGQVMGFNHAVVGYATVTDMVTAMVEDEDVQLLAMAKFIKGAHLDTVLRSLNW